MEPWRFTIEFDEEKAKRNGYNVDDLYDCVGEYAEQMGNVRIGLGTWQAKNREVQFGAQCPVCATLSKQPWVMQNIKSWRTYEDMNEPEGEDYLQIIRDISRNAFSIRDWEGKHRRPAGRRVVRGRSYPRRYGGAENRLILARFPAAVVEYVPYDLPDTF